VAQKILTVKVDKVDDVLKAFDALTSNRVLIGIPSTTAGRTDGAPINNATIGYINEFGSPAQNIPPRPFLVPGVRNAQERIIARLKQGIMYAARGQKEAAVRALHAVGMTAANSVKQKMRTGPFVPLSDVTLADRANRNTTTGRAGSRKGAKKELERRAQGEAPSTEFAKPLIDTSALLKSITYVIRGRWF
jgi:hypothetical protein